MNDEFNDDALDKLLRAADPLAPGDLPSDADTDVALRRLVAGAPAAGPGPTRGRRRREVAGSLRSLRPRAVASLTGAAAVIGTALALLLGSGGAPAYAVTRNSDGTVSVKLMRLAGLSGANRALASLGVRARFVHVAAMADYVAQTQPCKGLPAGAVRTITINPAEIPQGRMEGIAVNTAAQVRFYTEIPAGSMSALAYRVHAMALTKAGQRHFQVVPPGTGRFAGNSGTGNSGTGNSGAGNSGTGNTGTGNSGAGNSGTGNSGTGNSGGGQTIQLHGNVAGGPHWVTVYCGRSGTAVGGNSGTGNSGTGNSGPGNSGTGNSGS